MNTVPFSPPAGGGSGGSGSGRADKLRKRLDFLETRYRTPIENAKRELDSADDQWESIKNDQNDRLPSYSDWYLPVLTIIAICEVPLNRLSFELFFSESPLVCLAVAFVVGATLMVLAHFLGLTIRRLPYNIEANKKHKQGRTTTLQSALPSILAMAVCATLILGLCYGVGILRQGYLDFQSQPNPSLKEMLEQGQVIQAATGLVLHATLELVGWIFLGMNLAIVAVGTLISFFCHDPHPGYAKADKEKARTREQYKRITEQYGKELAAAKKNYG